MPKFSRYSLILLGFLALFGDIIANSRPLWCRVDGKNFFPAFKSVVSRDHLIFQNAQLRAFEQNNTWGAIASKDKIMPLIAYSASQNTSDKKKPPFSPGATGERHWLGTDIDGRDVAAGLISGARSALFIATVAMMIALLLGGFLGAIAGYFGDHGLKIKLSFLIALIPGAFILIFITFLSRKNIGVPDGMTIGAWLKITALIAISTFSIGWLMSKSPFLSKKIRIPADIIISRLAEITSSIPFVVLILSISAMMTNRSLINLVVLIGCLMWPGSARFLRAELLKIREMEYIRAAKGLGIPEWRIILRHALPNAVRPLMVAFTLSAGAAVLLEATLAFLNIGTYSPTQVTWGQMLYCAKNNIELWWVWLLPGLVICILVGALFEWSEYLNAQK